MNKRIYFNRFEGKKRPEGAKLITRPGKYGNPYKLKQYSREEALRLYRLYLENKLLENPGFLGPLWGFDLACTCLPGEKCHGDIILDKLNEIYNQQKTEI